MHAPAILFFSAAAAIACFIVRKAFILQTTYRLPYLHSYTFFLASWNALVLFSIFQYILAVKFLPGAAWFPLMLATNPLFITVMAVSLYFLSAFMSQLSGRSLTKIYMAAFVLIWGSRARCKNIARSVTRAILFRKHFASKLRKQPQMTRTSFPFESFVAASKTPLRSMHPGAPPRMRNCSQIDALTS